MHFLIFQFGFLYSSVFATVNQNDLDQIIAKIKEGPKDPRTQSTSVVPVDKSMAPDANVELCKGIFVQYRTAVSGCKRIQPLIDSQDLISSLSNRSNVTVDEIYQAVIQHLKLIYIDNFGSNQAGSA